MSTAQCKEEKMMYLLLNLLIACFSLCSMENNLEHFEKNKINIEKIRFPMNNNKTLKFIRDLSDSLMLTNVVFLTNQKDDFKKSIEVLKQLASSSLRISFQENFQNGFSSIERTQTLIFCFEVYCDIDKVN